MCCFDMPYTMMFIFILILNPYNDLDIISLCLKFTCYILFIIFLPIFLALDIISLPFHILNIFRRVCFSIPYSTDYFYDILLRRNPANEEMENLPSVESDTGLHITYYKT